MLNKELLFSSSKSSPGVLTVNNHYISGVELLVNYLDGKMYTTYLYAGINTFVGVSQVEIPFGSAQFADTPMTPNNNVKLSNNTGSLGNFNIARVIDTSKDAYVNIFID